MNRIYACIDLKSFYASVECVERNLNPLTTNLVVADASRTEKTICLAVTPSLKEYKIPGRARLFEVIKRVREVNYERSKKINYKKFKGKSSNKIELNNNPYLELDFIAAPPRMKLYMEYSANIYKVYLKYLSSDDIYVYSIDEVFCDITDYLDYYGLTAKELVTKIILDIEKTTGITATSGVGTNLFLAKVAMDVLAKHTNPNEYGVRIAYLDEQRYKEVIWPHKPISDIWRVGIGYKNKLEKIGIYTMGDVARISLKNEEILYKIFGVNAELLIDHAWGYEPCTIKDIKNFKPSASSICRGQVLHRPYNYSDALLIVNEMMDNVALELEKNNYVTSKLVLDIIYDVENIKKGIYNAEVTTDRYGRIIPKNAHGTINIGYNTRASIILKEQMTLLYKKIVDKNLLIRKINIACCNLEKKIKPEHEQIVKQMDLFKSDNESEIENKIKYEESEAKIQNVLNDIKNKYGKNSILKGMNLLDSSTARERNSSVGGHKDE